MASSSVHVLERSSSANAKNTEEYLLEVVNQDVGQGENEELIKEKEQAILKLGVLYAKNKDTHTLGNLIKETRSFLQYISKAKAAKLVRDLLDLYLEVCGHDTVNEIAIQVCNECIEWAKKEKRTFLRQALESRLVALYIDSKLFGDALKLGSQLNKELKKMDDKALLMEVQLCESRTYHALGNIPKSRAALTSARTTASGIYCPPKLQAALDLQSGILHAEEKDFKTAYSYFYEAFEGYDSIDNAKAVEGLKYMLLCKIMMNSPEDVQSIVSGKLALRYAGTHIEAMLKIASASKNRSLFDFQNALTTYYSELSEDQIIQRHFKALYDSLLEQNLCRIIEPFSRVEAEHVAKLIDLPLDVVEKKLSQMILDKKLNGILDQGAGVLIIFDEKTSDMTYDNSVEIIHKMGSLVDALYKKAKLLS